MLVPFLSLHRDLVQTHRIPMRQPQGMTFPLPAGGVLVQHQERLLHAEQFPAQTTAQGQEEHEVLEEGLGLGCSFISGCPNEWLIAVTPGVNVGMA